MRPSEGERLPRRGTEPSRALRKELDGEIRGAAGLRRNGDIHTRASFTLSRMIYGWKSRLLAALRRRQDRWGKGPALVAAGDLAREGGFVIPEVPGRTAGREGRNRKRFSGA